MLTVIFSFLGPFVASIYRYRIFSIYTISVRSPKVLIRARVKCAHKRHWQCWVRALWEPISSLGNLPTQKSDIFAWARIMLNLFLTITTRMSTHTCARLTCICITCISLLIFNTCITSITCITCMTFITWIYLPVSIVWLVSIL